MYRRIYGQTHTPTHKHTSKPSDEHTCQNWKFWQVTKRPLIPTQRARDAKEISMLWRYHEIWYILILWTSFGVWCFAVEFSVRRNIKTTALRNALLQNSYHAKFSSIVGEKSVDTFNMKRWIKENLQKFPTTTSDPKFLISSKIHRSPITNMVWFYPSVDK